MENNCDKYVAYSFIGDRKLTVSSEVISLFNEYRQVERNDKEAGGLILGRVSRDESNYFLDSASTPTESDISGRHSFFRSAAGHNPFYEHHYDISDGNIFYLGEWHTHPELVPKPSQTDLSNWKHISGVRQDVDFLFFPIQGIKKLEIWFISTKTQEIGKIKEINRKK